MPSENPWSANKQFSYVRKNVHFIHIVITLTCLQGCASFQYKTYSLINDLVCNFSTIRSSWRSVGHWSKKIVSDQWDTAIHTYEDVLLKIFLPKNKFQVFFQSCSLAILLWRLNIASFVTKSVMFWYFDHYMFKPNLYLCTSNKAN